MTYQLWHINYIRQQDASFILIKAKHVRWHHVHQQVYNKLTY